MKTLARTGSVLSFTFFFLPGVSLLSAGDETGVKFLGMILMGIACFAGTLLWMLGEKFCVKQERDAVA